MQNEGWDVVRPAIATTVSVWIMQAFLAHNLLQKHEDGLELYDNALDVLRWGRRVWRSVPIQDRGAFFEPTFERGVRSLRLEAMVEICRNASGIDPGKCSLEDLYEESQDIIRDVAEDVMNQRMRENSRMPKVDPGFISSFYVYPSGRAYAMQGYYHDEMAKRCALAGESVDAILDHTLKSATAYLQAANTYPDDDELHPWYLKCALGALYRSGAPIKDVLPVLQRIRLSVPKMNEIWEYYPMAQAGRDKALQQALRDEEDLLRGLAEWKFTMEDKMMPGYYSDG